MQELCYIVMAHFWDDVSEEEFEMPVSVHTTEQSAADTAALYSSAYVVTVPLYRGV